MGLASKLAAAQGGAPPGGQYPPQGGYPPQGQQKPGYPGQPSYQAYPGQGGPPPGGAPPPGQYPPQQGGYGGAPGGGAPPGGYKQALTQFIQDNGLGHIFPPNHPVIDHIANTAPQKVETFCQRWRIPIEVGRDIVALGLYDIVLYIDDSGSMAFEQNGERIQDMKVMLERVAQAATMFDDDGISVRFMNSQPPPQLTDHIRNEQQINQLMQNIQFKGLTPMGTELRKKIVEPMILSQARAGQLRKPVLVIMITDGQPGGEPPNAIRDTISYTFNELSRTPLGRKGASFQLCQVGNDAKAREFLNKLDTDYTWGSQVDCNSDFETEQVEASRSVPPVDLTPELYILKILLGAIDKTYDEHDENKKASVNQQYGAPPGQGGYGAPGQGYPPQQGGYGAPPGQGGYPPQQGGYPPQQGGYPPQQGGSYPPQGGRPPQQGGYPPQQGGGYPPQQGGFGQNPRY